MPPRKSGTSSREPNVVRRVVKTITTEEIMEIAPSLKPKKTNHKKRNPESRVKKSAIVKKTSSKRSLGTGPTKPATGRKPTAKAISTKASSSKNPSTGKMSAAQKQRQSRKSNSDAKRKDTPSITPPKRQKPPAKQITKKQTSTKQRTVTTSKAAARMKVQSSRTMPVVGPTVKVTSVKKVPTSMRYSFVPKTTSAKTQLASKKKTATTRKERKRSLQSPISKGNTTAPKSTAKQKQSFTPTEKGVIMSLSTLGGYDGPPAATSLAACDRAESGVHRFMHTSLARSDFADSLPALVEPDDSIREGVLPSTSAHHATHGDTNASGISPKAYLVNQTVVKRTSVSQASSSILSTQPLGSTSASITAGATASRTFSKAILPSQPSLKLNSPARSIFPHMSHNLTRSASIESLPALIEPSENPTSSLPVSINAKLASHSVGASRTSSIGYRMKHAATRPADYVARASSSCQLVQPFSKLIPELDTAAGATSANLNKNKLPEPTPSQSQSSGSLAALLGCNANICDDAHSRSIPGTNWNANWRPPRTGVPALQNDEDDNNDLPGALGLLPRKPKHELNSSASLQSRSVFGGIQGIEQTERKSCATEHRPGSSLTTFPPYSLNQTLSESLDYTKPKLSTSPSRLNATGIWQLTHDTGYIPDGFHSCEKPERRDIGVFSPRAAAVQKGQHLVGSKVGFSWQEVQEAGDLDVVVDTQDRWEIHWSPLDSEYSRVTASLLSTAVGRWIVEVERGYVPNGFQAYCEPTRQTLGPFPTRDLAVAEGKKEVGADCGWGWDEVVADASLQLRENSSNRWEAYWDPPDSEYSHVVVKPLPPAQPVDPGDCHGASGIHAAEAPETTHQLARSGSASAQPGGTGTQSRMQAAKRCTNDIWEVLHETGFVPDRFHSPQQPTKRSLGFFSSRIEAVNKGKAAVGSVVEFSWSEVREDAEFKVLVDIPDRWEVRWSPPADPYSHVTVRRFSTERGRWFVDIDHDCHSYTTCAKKTLGPFLTRDLAVGVGKKEVGAYYGYEWEEVASGGDLEVSVDTWNRWIACWSPACSLHTEVVAFLLPEPQIRDRGE